MTLPTSFPLSMSQIATELGLGLPMSLNHPWAIALANKNTLPLSFSDLLGKCGRYDGSLATGDQGGQPDVLYIVLPDNVPFFGGQFATFSYWYNFGPIGQLQFNIPPATYSGKILIKNNTLGLSGTLSRAPSPNQNFWQSNSGTIQSGILRPGVIDSYTILPTN